MNDKPSLADKLQQTINRESVEIQPPSREKVGADLSMQEETYKAQNLDNIPKVMPVELPIGDPEVIAQRNQLSRQNFPSVTVDEDEYVILAISRHVVGLAGILISSMLVFVVLMSAWILLCFMPNKFEAAQSMKGNLNLIFGSLTALTLLGGYVGYSTYRANRFVVTNERAIQWIVTGLFNQKRQVINLESVEDISFTQVGLLQHLLNYGTIRLSTTGEESTYTFVYARNPSKVAEIIGEITENARENQFIPDELLEQGKKMSR